MTAAFYSDVCGFANTMTSSPTFPPIASGPLVEIGGKSVLFLATTVNHQFTPLSNRRTWCSMAQRVFLRSVSWWSEREFGDGSPMAS